MDALLAKVTAQAMNYAIRSGITITTTYAIRQCASLLKETPPSSQAREELVHLQLRLESKIRIISPAIDTIELISARGNTSLESAVSLTKEIRYEIQRLGANLREAVEGERAVKTKSSRTRDETEKSLRRIVHEIKTLLLKIEDAVPLINLAITTSGVNLSTKLSGSISPSRLLQASTFLTAADSKFTAPALQGSRRVQVGPAYVLSLYMLFAGHVWRDEDVRGMTWKEVLHKARVKLMRVPLMELYDLPGEKTRTVEGGIVAETSIPGEDGKASEFAYQLVLIEDLDDDRVHTFDEGEERPGPFEDVASAGIRDVLPVHEISKVFYADTGKILNIGSDAEGNNPVLLLRRDVHAEPPRRMMLQSQIDGRDGYDDSEINGVQHNGTPTQDSPRRHPDQASSSKWRLPSDLDPEWMAFEVYHEAAADSSDSEDPDEPVAHHREPTPTASLSSALSKLNFPSTTSPSPNRPQISPSPTLAPPKQQHPQIKTSLSLLELLLKLTSLQQFRQQSHLAIEDELLNFFLEDSSSTAGDKQLRQRTRMEAVRRVGFDPYNESPVKRRGESHLEGARGKTSPRPEFDAHAFVHERGGRSWQGSVEIRRSVEDDDHFGLSSPSPMTRLPDSREGTPHSLTRPGASRTRSQTSLLATPPNSAGPGFAASKTRSQKNRIDRGPSTSNSSTPGSVGEIQDN